MAVSTPDHDDILHAVLSDEAARPALAAAMSQAAIAGPMSAEDLAAAVGRIVARAVAQMPPALLARLVQGLTVPAAATPPPGFRATLGELPTLDAAGVPGLSVVTCCMNRNANLMRALPSWLVHDAVSEVIVVDWSSDVPVDSSLAAAGIDDPRVKIVRVEGEPRWILSHAFNVGFRAASCAFLLKADADIVLAPGFFAENPVLDDGFVAGNWRRAETGQAYVNGFFLASRKVIAAVGGFNEFIRTYGWDDDELYARLVHHGFRRMDIAPGSVTHLDHDDTARLGLPAPGTAQSLADTLMASPIYHIRKNRYIATVMPEWTAKSPPIPFRIEAGGPDRLVLRRGNWDPSAVPAHVQATAERHALVEMGAWTLGRDLLFLDPAVARALLDRAEGALTRIDILLALRGRMDVVHQAGAHVVLRTDPAILRSDGAVKQAILKDMLDRLTAQGFRPVFMSALEALPDPAREACGDVAFLPDWMNIGPTTAVLPRLVYQGGLPQDEGVLRMSIGEDTLDRLAKLAQRFPAQPPV